MGQRQDGEREDAGGEAVADANQGSLAEAGEHRAKPASGHEAEDDGIDEDDNIADVVEDDGDEDEEDDEEDEEDDDDEDEDEDDDEKDRIADPYAGLSFDDGGGAMGSRAAGFSCQTCETLIVARYFTYDDKAVCPDCVEQIQRHVASAEGGFGDALMWGSLAALAGFLLYWGVLAVTGYEVGLIAIVVGILVGKGVRKGAGTHQHWVYRLMGVGLTYVSIVSGYVPTILETMVSVGAAELLLAFVIALISPVLLAMEAEVISLIIIGVGLWEGWRFSGAPKLALQGPFEASTRTQPA